MRLQTEPTGTVTVTPATTSSAIRLSPSSLTFTASNWGERRTVTVTANVDDAYDEHTATVTHTVAGADYDAIEAPEITVRASRSTKARRASTRSRSPRRRSTPSR